MKQPLIIALLLICSAAFGQNLVPNPSFEEFSSCPEPTTGMYRCDSWINFGETPDYFNSCSQPFGTSNLIGEQDPYEGNAYVGLVAFSDPPGDTREFIGVELINLLETSVTYYVSMFVSKAEGGSYDLVNNACNNIGARFTTVKYDSLNITGINNWAHVKVDSIVTDTLNWLKISGTVDADSAYKYLVLGNFFDDANTDILHPPSPPEYRQAYYYIDEVCVSQNPMDCGLVSVDDLETKYLIQFYPNPVSEVLTVESANFIESISVFDIYGRLVIQSDDRNKKQTNIAVDSLVAGIYTVAVVDDTGQRLTRRILKK